MDDAGIREREAIPTRPTEPLILANASIELGNASADAETILRGRWPDAETLAQRLLTEGEVTRPFSA